MAVSLQDVVRQKDSLLRKHPELVGYSCRRIMDTDMDLDGVASFMWRCWSHDYPEGLTIVSEPSIKWNLGNGLMDENSSLAVYDGDRLCGVVLGYRRTLILRGQKVSSVINTGFSVPKEYRGKGICQFLRLNYMEANLEAGLPITFGWYDTRHNKPGTAYSIYAHKNRGGGGYASCGYPFIW